MLQSLKCAAASRGDFSEETGKMSPMPRFSRRVFLQSSALVSAALLGSGFGIAGEAIESSPDRRTDSDFLQHGVKEISDEDLLAAMDLSKPELQAVREAVAKNDFSGAYR